MTHRSSGAPPAPLTPPPGHWKEPAHLIFRIGRYVFASGDFRTSWSTAGESTAFCQGCAPCAGSGISIPDDAAPLPALGEGHRRSDDKASLSFGVSTPRPIISISAAPGRPGYSERMASSE